MNEQDLGIDFGFEEDSCMNPVPGEENHLYGTIGDFCGLMDTYDPDFVLEKLPPEYRDMLIHAIDKRRLQSP